MKTQKGTELKMLNIKGKDYLPVSERLVWFREEHPNWGIETEIYKLADKAAIVKATIKNESGLIIAQAHKNENVTGFPDYLEKAETGAIGRALGMCGYGTQFEPAFIEGEDRLVDAPQSRSSDEPF